MSRDSRSARGGYFPIRALTSLFWLPAPPAAAQQGASAPILLPDVVVSATATPEPAGLVGSSISVLTGADLQAEQRRTVSDALAQLPGLNIVTTGGPGGQASLFVRGTNSNHVKVLIDGIEANDPSNPNGSFDFGQLLTADLDRIEVLRGPQSGLYGSDAIGGVVSVFTKRGEGPPKVNLRVEGGSFGTFNQNLGFSGGTPIYDYAFDLAHFQLRDLPVTPPELLRPGTRAIGNAYDNWTLSSKVGLRLSDDVYTNATMRYLDGHLRFTGNDFSTFPAFPAAQQSRQDTQQLFTRGEVHYDPLGTTIRNRVGVSFTQAYTTNKDPDTAFGPTLQTANFGQRLRTDYQGQVEVFRGETLVAGAETETTRLTNLPTYASNANTAGYLQLLSNIGDLAFLASNVRYDSNRAFGDYATFRFAPSFHVPVTGTILKGSYGTGFKAPTLSQLFVDFPAFDFRGNPNLRPETSTGYDVGFEQPLPVARPLSFGATYYQNEIRNLIDTNATFTSFTNIGRARTYGTEAFVAWAPSETVRMRADYTLTIARNEILMQDLLRRPRDKGSLQAFWTPIAPLTLSGTVITIGRFIDGNRDFSIPRLVNRGHTTVNVAATYDVNPNAQVFARADNLFDLRYQDPTGFLQPGLAAYGGMRLTY